MDTVSFCKHFCHQSSATRLHHCQLHKASEKPLLNFVTGHMLTTCFSSVVECTRRVLMARTHLCKWHVHWLMRKPCSSNRKWCSRMDIIDWSSEKKNSKHSVFVHTAVMITFLPCVFNAGRRSVNCCIAFSTSRFAWSGYLYCNCQKTSILNSDGIVITCATKHLNFRKQHVTSANKIRYNNHMDRCFTYLIQISRKV